MLDELMVLLVRLLRRADLNELDLQGGGRGALSPSQAKSSQVKLSAAESR